jgi:hypothetical protein
LENLKEEERPEPWDRLKKQRHAKTLKKNTTPFLDAIEAPGKPRALLPFSLIKI